MRVRRSCRAVPAHATFAVLMGYYIGKGKFEAGRGYMAIIGLLSATLFHGAYDYFWFISFVPGIWIGAILSLVVGLWLARKAIRIHQEASPFRHKTTTEPEMPETKNPDSGSQGLS